MKKLLIILFLGIIISCSSNTKTAEKRCIMSEDTGIIVNVEEVNRDFTKYAVTVRSRNKLATTSRMFNDTVFSNFTFYTNERYRIGDTIQITKK